MLKIVGGKADVRVDYDAAMRMRRREESDTQPEEAFIALSQCSAQLLLLAITATGSIVSEDKRHLRHTYLNRGDPIIACCLLGVYGPLSEASSSHGLSPLLGTIRHSSDEQKRLCVHSPQLKEQLVIPVLPCNQ